MLRGSMSAAIKLRRLVIVLGDQLDRDSPLLQELDPAQDLVFMAEVREEAKRLLESGQTPVDEISVASGYEDPSFFRRLFKRRTGLTPSQYRRMFQPVLAASRGMRP